jgi:DNA-binding transcriptional MerR regulator
MTAKIEPLWTIDQLGAQVALALSVDYSGSLNGRVRDVPDRRTIRYYTTLGLLDRPAEMRGRTAFYGRKHLLQLVAIKRLQARGMPLVEVQQRLLGLTTPALSRLANLPSSLETLTPGSATPVAPASPAPERRARRFWSTVPAPQAANAEHPAAGKKQEAANAVLLQSIPLDAEVHLVLAAERPIEEEDLSAIRVAAAPLLKLLEVRRLRLRKERGQP